MMEIQKLWSRSAFQVYYTGSNIEDDVICDKKLSYFIRNKSCQKSDCYAQWNYENKWEIGIR